MNMVKESSEGGMVSEFEEAGLRFRYPEDWQLEREENEEGWSVCLQSQGTAFVIITLREDMPSVDRMAEIALAALKEEYPDLEADDCVGSVAGQPAVGHDIRFFSLDLTNTCWTRCFYTSQGTVLVLCQVTDLELAASEPVLQAICASIQTEDD